MLGPGDVGRPLGVCMGYSLQLFIREVCSDGRAGGARQVM